MNLSQLRDDVVAVIIQAGRKVPEFSARRDRGVVGTKESIGGIVTELDEDLEAQLVAKLSELAPGGPDNR
jgi:fructose-1,6-bisphosphatase/inositol monophosphatase family enzyme